MTIALLAVLAGAEGWQGIETYGQAKKTWLRTFLELPNGIPDRDTFRRIFAQIDPEAMESSFCRWVETLMEHLDSEVIAIDGKTVKGFYERNQNLKALQLVSAWADEHRLVLGQCDSFPVKSQDFS